MFKFWKKKKPKKYFNPDAAIKNMSNQLKELDKVLKDLNSESTQKSVNMYCDYLTDLGKRYKEGKLSKVMFEKYYECTLNNMHFESNNWNIFQWIQFATSSLKALVMMSQRHIFIKGGIINHKSEIIIPKKRNGKTSLE